MATCPRLNFVIFTGEEILINRQGTQPTSILPPGIASSVKKVHQEIIFESDMEVIKVEFHNGECATLLMYLGLTDPLEDDDLKEFKARCLMIYDL